ncbi:MAG: hypothetical protein MR652_01760 [Blautia sp.]|uniref:hypothetical protein n=1 Tax=Blautia sp. TaxID=1955243 RepID=UPI0025C2CD23|nr:hypothetical protein [Blautia sp.]MCI6301899.1 hypothetical protein [Blautia sp.]MDD6412592.1 hypothetical protein [Blautia sp.]
MSFKSNDCQQLTFDDSLFSLTEREKKTLKKSWAKVFADEIFPAIDEERFSVLYSDKASRPNTPVNVIVGALIIKELFDYSDDEIVENLMLLLKDSDTLLKICGNDYLENTEYQLFIRCLSDQTVINDGKRRMRTREDGTMNS